MRRKTFKSNEDYFKFIEENRGKFKSIEVIWEDKNIRCKYILKERRLKNGNSSNNNANAFNTNDDNSSDSRNS